MKTFAILVLWGILLPVAGGAQGTQAVPSTIERLRQETERWAERGTQPALLLRTRLALADALRAQARFGEAAREYELALTLTPSQKERHHVLAVLGRCYEQLQERQRMIEAYEKALALDRKDAELWDALGQAYLRVDLYAKAVEAFQHALQLRQGSFDTLFALGKAYQQMGTLDLAIEQYHRALAIASRPEAYLAVSECHAREGQLEAAIATLKEAAARQPQAAYDVQLGSLYLRQGALDEAKTMWERVLSQEPGRDNLRLQLALLYSRRGLWQHADQALQRLRQRYPHEPILAFCQAMVVVRRGEPGQARGYLAASAAQSPPAWLQPYLRELDRLLRGQQIREKRS